MRTVPQGLRADVPSAGRTSSLDMIRSLLARSADVPN
jgi:hypothetical protein